MNQEYKEKLSGKIEKNFSDLEMRIMEDIVRRIKKTGEITSTADWQINRLLILGASSEDIERMLKEALDASYPEMFELYDKVIDWEYVRNKDIYEQINQRFIPYEENTMLQQLTEGYIRQTKEDLENITQSLGFCLDYGNGRKVITPLAQIYQGYLDAAMLDITSGAFDYGSVLRRVVKQLTNSGLRTIDYASGHSNRVNVAARSAVMTGITQLSGQIVDMNAEELGTDYFEIDWHAGARPTHQVWQGRVYSKEELVSVCGLGSVTGLEGANCYHGRHLFFPGISVRNWSDEWLDAKIKEENTPKKFRGKEYTVYEAKQKQRQMETAMRAQRQKVKLLQSGGADPDEVMLARCKYQGQLNEYGVFSKKMGLKQERERIYLDLQGRVAPRTVTAKLSDTTDKWAKEALKDLRLSEKSFCMRNKEMLEVYDTDGKFIMAKRGDMSSVRLSPLDLSQIKGSVITHNHPSGGAFSKDDLQFLRLWPISELRAVTETVTFYIRKPSVWPREINSREKLNYEIDKIKLELKNKYQKLYRNGIINKTQRHQMFSEEVNQVFSERFGIEFGKEYFDEKDKV